MNDLEKKLASLEKKIAMLEESLIHLGEFAEKASALLQLPLMTFVHKSEEE